MLFTGSFLPLVGSQRGSFVLFLFVSLTPSITLTYSRCSKMFVQLITENQLSKDVLVGMSVAGGKMS